MRKKPGIEQVEKQLYALTESAEDDSALWSYLNFLDDLAKGYLAYRPIRNDIESLDEMLDHDAMIVTYRENCGHRFMYTHGGAAERKAAREGMLAYLAHTLPGPEEFPKEALRHLPMIGREVVAAITMSRETSPRPAVMLFYLPQFDENVIHAALKGMLKL